MYFLKYKLAQNHFMTYPNLPEFGFPTIGIYSKLLKSSFFMKFKSIVPLWSKANTNMQGSAYHLKARELTSSAIPSACQYAHWGYAGIGCQLHPLKAEHFMWMPWSINQKTMYMVKYIIQKLFSSRVQLSYHDFSVHFRGVLEMVVNCIKSKLWRKSLFFKKS